ncbi:MAG: hypothetical protein A2148_02500 [Chloroflexi bacterium RBG_16_68_14]|nr:MAG: hypothetical protein A2148_02500 [Chloroflexi bacterium RBG_16_68_14]
MERKPDAWPALRHGAWVPVSQEPDHPLAGLDGQPLAGGELRVLLGPTSRFGARYFRVLLAAGDDRLSREPVLTGLHHSGPLPSYNWIEVAETKERVTLTDGSVSDIGAEGIERLFALLFAILPVGGHLMAEYDSARWAETARALAHGAPPIATPLGELLFRIGCGARFKDWQIAEGGSEGPRKLQAYKPASREDALRWRREVAEELRIFLEGPPASSEVVQAARQRAENLLPLLSSAEERSP